MNNFKQKLLFTFLFLILANQSFAINYFLANANRVISHFSQQVPQSSDWETINKAINKSIATGKDISQTFSMIEEVIKKAAPYGHTSMSFSIPGSTQKTIITFLRKNVNHSNEVRDFLLTLSIVKKRSLESSEVFLPIIIEVIEFIIQEKENEFNSITRRSSLTNLILEFSPAWTDETPNEKEALKEMRMAEIQEAKDSIKRLSALSYFNISDPGKEWNYVSKALTPAHISKELDEVIESLLASKLIDIPYEVLLKIFDLTYFSFDSRLPIIQQSVRSKLILEFIQYAGNTKEGSDARQFVKDLLTHLEDSLSKETIPSRKILLTSQAIRISNVTQKSRAWGIAEEHLYTDELKHRIYQLATFLPVGIDYPDFIKERFIGHLPEIQSDKVSMYTELLFHILYYYPYRTSLLNIKVHKFIDRLRSSSNKEVVDTILGKILHKISEVNSDHPVLKMEELDGIKKTCSQISRTFNH